MTAILFDLDGTLIDSSLGIKNGFVHTFKSLELDLPDDATIRSFMGPPLEATFAAINPNPDFVEKAVLTYRSDYRKNGVFQGEIYKGVKELLNSLLADGHQLFVATSKNQEMADLMLSHFDLDTYFTAIYGASKTAHKKSDVISAILTDYQLKADEVVMIGDTKYDIIGGQTTGTKTIAVTWGFGLTEDLLDLNPDYVATTPTDIKKALETIVLIPKSWTNNC